MTHETDFLWYKLFRAEGFGTKSISMVYRTIHNSGFSLERVFGMSKFDFENTFPGLGRGRLKKANFDALQRLNEEVLYQEYQKLKNNRIKIIYPGHQLYPESLSGFMEHDIPDVPPILFCKGQLPLLKAESVSIVGSRSASDEGMKIARRFAADLALQGKNVISGYAKGIDTNAHLGALEKDGTTTIVLSFGIFGFAKKKVFGNLRWEGNTLVVSQFRPTENWNARNAMSRNKLVCALSEAVIIIESREEKGKDGNMSGTFNAGKTALEIKTPLFVISPAFFNNPPLGNEELINRGGIEIHPKGGIAKLLKYLEMKTTVAAEKQISFFK